MCFPFARVAFFDTAFEKWLRRGHALRGSRVTSSLPPDVCGYGVCWTAAPSGAVRCGDVRCEAVASFVARSSEFMEPPPLLVCIGTWVVGWLAIGFWSCWVGCWLVGSWAAKFGWRGGL